MTDTPSTMTETPSTMTETPSTMTETPSTITETPSTMTETSDDTMFDVTKGSASDDILVNKFYKKLDNDIEIQDDE
jgi:hypothetical protein